MRGIVGPLPTADAYCTRREAALDHGGPGAPCRDEVLDPAIVVPTGGAKIRGVRVVQIGEGLHLLVATERGWYGRELVTASTDTGHFARIDAVRFADMVDDGEDEIVVEATRSHEPCGCSDLWHSVTQTFVCTVDAELHCTDGIVTAEDMHLGDVWSWTSTLAIDGDGRGRRTITQSEHVSRRTLQNLRGPIRLVFQRP